MGSYTFRSIMKVASMMILPASAAICLLVLISCTTVSSEGTKLEHVGNDLGSAAAAQPKIDTPIIRNVRDEKSNKSKRAKWTRKNTKARNAKKTRNGKQKRLNRRAKKRSNKKLKKGTTKSRKGKGQRKNKERKRRRSRRRKIRRWRIIKKTRI